jgi:hypothetical protein
MGAGVWLQANAGLLSVVLLRQNNGESWSMAFRTEKTLESDRPGHSFAILIGGPKKLARRLRALEVEVRVVLPSSKCGRSQANAWLSSGQAPLVCSRSAEIYC